MLLALLPRQLLKDAARIGGTRYLFSDIFGYLSYFVNTECHHGGQNSHGGGPPAIGDTANRTAVG